MKKRSKYLLSKWAAELIHNHPEKKNNVLKMVTKEINIITFKKFYKKTYGKDL